MVHSILLHRHEKRKINEVNFWAKPAGVYITLFNRRWSRVLADSGRLSGSLKTMSHAHPPIRDLFWVDSELKSMIFWSALNRKPELARTLIERFLDWSWSGPNDSRFHVLCPLCSLSEASRMSSVFNPFENTLRIWFLAQESEKKRSQRPLKNHFEIIVRGSKSFETIKGWVGMQSEAPISVQTASSRIFQNLASRSCDIPAGSDQKFTS